MTEQVNDDIRMIPLTGGLFAIVDAVDYPYLSQFKWCAKLDKGEQTYYALRGVRKGDKTETILMHHEIIGKKPGYISDHKNTNGLDNRRCNLRHATQLENLRNRKPRSDQKYSQYKGVSFHKRKTPKGRQWEASIKVNGVENYLGSYFTEIEAAEAYDKAAKKYFGEFAWLNLEKYRTGVGLEN